jgi:kynurenine 3-monooxygenase
MGSANTAGRITVIGAGLTGPLLATLLAERGFQVEIYERRPDMRKAGFTGGRSINLAVSTRGIHALQQAGVWERMRRIIVPMKGRMMHSVKEELTFQPYGKDESEVINSVSRAELNSELMTAAEAHGVTIHFNQRCTGADFHTGAVRLRDEETRRETIVESDTVIGTDGSASAMRSAMLPTHRFNFSQDYLDYGYKELIIPAGPDGRHLLEEVNALHIWPRGTYMLIALPNIDGTFACILFLPFEGKESFASLDTEAKVLSFFESRFPGVVLLMPQLIQQYFTNPTGSMVTIRCYPWAAEGKSLLLGDAAHAIVPFFGQGLNCAFEDCTLIIEYLDHYGPDWPRVFADFQQMRKPDTDAIADMALENFVEMRDRVADSHFLFKKKVELALEARYPDIFVPKYAMVTFHRVPYSVALARGRVQERILAKLCGSIDRLEDLNWSEAGYLLARELTPLVEAR